MKVGGMKIENLIVKAVIALTAYIGTRTYIVPRIKPLIPKVL